MKTMVLTEYFARKGSRFSDEDAQIIGPELERLAQEGRSTAADIVNAARPDSSPLHRYFEWDDAKAAELHRQQQARVMADSIVIIVKDTRGQREEQVRAFHAVPVMAENLEGQKEPLPGLRQYMPISALQEDPERARLVIEEAYSSLVGWRARYDVYRTLFPQFDQRFGSVFTAIEKLEDGPQGAEKRAS